jgi:hypothetical protein
MGFPMFEQALAAEVEAGRLPGAAVAASWKTALGKIACRLRPI